MPISSELHEEEDFASSHGSERFGISDMAVPMSATHIYLGLHPLLIHPLKASSTPQLLSVPPPLSTGKGGNLASKIRISGNSDFLASGTPFKAGVNTLAAVTGHI